MLVGFIFIIFCVFWLNAINNTPFVHKNLGKLLSISHMIFNFHIWTPY